MHYFLNLKFFNSNWISMLQLVFQDCVWFGCSEQLHLNNCIDFHKLKITALFSFVFYKNREQLLKIQH